MLNARMTLTKLSSKIIMLLTEVAFKNICIGEARHFLNIISKIFISTLGIFTFHFLYKSVKLRLCFFHLHK